jgi:hypothetical protein
MWVKFGTEDLCVTILGGSKCHENHSNESHALLYNVSEILPLYFTFFLQSGKKSVQMGLLQVLWKLKKDRPYLRL